VLSPDQEPVRVEQRRTKRGAADSLIQIALPKGTPPEAEVAVRRLIQLVATLARRAAQLQEALDSRIVIEQAKGVLVERFDLSPDEAFDLLRRAARSNRMPIRQLAAAVVSSRETPPELGNGTGRRPPLRMLRVPPAAR
jgi:AmiR/NasT family two-component response regulator